VIPSIEIKVNIDGDVDKALSVLEEFGTETQNRQIWFAEDRLGVSDGKLSLLDAGVSVRFRSGDGSDDVTMKLRPCDEKQLVGTWSSSFTAKPFEYRIEGDWSGSRHLLAASAVTTQPQASVLAAVAPGANSALALDDNQLRFFDDCAPPGVHADRLIAMGPISATKWTDLTFGALNVTMERWTVLDMDFLELSVRAKPGPGQTAQDVQNRATSMQRELLQVVTERGVVISQRRENKTERVLTALASSAR
jgi:hypothetical protein